MGWAIFRRATEKQNWKKSSPALKNGKQKTKVPASIAAGNPKGKSELLLIISALLPSRRWGRKRDTKLTNTFYFTSARLPCWETWFSLFLGKLTLAYREHHFSNQSVWSQLERSQSLWQAPQQELDPTPQPANTPSSTITVPSGNVLLQSHLPVCAAPPSNVSYTTAQVGKMWPQCCVEQKDHGEGSQTSALPSLLTVSGYTQLWVYQK